MSTRMICCAALAAFVVAAPAQAKSTAVRYADLDLVSPEGVKALNKRVFKAAREVCNYNLVFQTRQYAAADRCIRTAMKKAAPQVQTAILQFRRDVRRADAATALDIAS